MQTVTKKVEYADVDHVWIDGQQYISLNRFNMARSEDMYQVKKLTERVEKLNVENKALRILLKDHLNIEEVLANERTTESKEV